MAYVINPDGTISVVGAKYDSNGNIVLRDYSKLENPKRRLMNYMLQTIFLLRVAIQKRKKGKDKKRSFRRCVRVCK